MLSDTTIMSLLMAGDISIVPAPNPENIQPVSVDLLLGNSFCMLPRNQFDEHHQCIANRFTVNPGMFVLASTLERVKLPAHIAATVHGKSTWARRGLMVEAAGLVDPGFDGTITLELKNLSHLPILLSAGDRICQMSFHAIDTSVLRPYGSTGLGSHYQGQTKAEPARG